ncbi:alkaline phosphatase family protein-like protein [Dothidotthia symphoricarpi CBS 119687]|uniref:Alkaline phosphatase family protein-like protein n=1 Tax=Dothidotthia symphoricarpi CBS 119687 TaxID=1392245 RepID=A0A6A6A3K8_9PLEO|nr:alkaline phosphatase family protein-like protein [Dothidotthia symphoricarpi CBS 119687]KAF2125487.1 alkaline phosphatase family protein-like protein [Dothidotthia symphoricarpi CBS 119687]
MPSASDIVTLISSLVLRGSIYVFLRWIPTTAVPPLAAALALIYIPSFFSSFQDTAQYQVISDELDIIVKETVSRDDDSEEVELIDGAEDGPLEELDVQETVLYEEREPKILRTLLTGLPSPSSAFWSWVTFGINMALLAMTLDVVYRAPLLHPCHDASFGRVGYVSDHSANILVREPYAFDVKVLYRSLDEPDRSWMHTTLHASQPDEWLTRETDFTTVMSLDRLRSDTPYEYVIETSSGNKTGTFTTAPRPGRLSLLKENKYTFVHSSCIKPRVPYTPFQHPLEFPGMKHLAKWLPELKPYFMLFLGDFIYVDVPHRQGKDAETYRREYRQVYSSPSWPAVSNNLPWIHVIDDHEIQNDWSGNMTGVAVPAYDAFHHYNAAPNPPPHRKGHTYFSFTQGPADFFLLDTRRYRSPETSDPNDESKTMLGEQQLSDLLAWIHKTPPQGVHWKIIVTGIPFTKNWQFGSEDTWGGYLHERRRILEASWDLSSSSDIGVVLLSGDRHEFAATAFPPPKNSKWPVSATVHEFSTSPLSMFYLPVRTYKEIDDEDVCIKYLPDGNSKFGAVEVTTPQHGEQSFLNYRLFVDGREVWTHVISTPPVREGSQRARDAVWG